MIRIQDVSKKINEKLILQDINLNIHEGDVFSLIGPNGAGKTTLVRLILSLYKPTEGKIYIDGVDNSTLEFERKKYEIGFLLDNIGLLKKYTAWDNLEFFDRIYNERDCSQNRKDRINDIFKKVSLYEHRNEKITFFSRGMKQRLSLGRALLNNPKLLILDEPLRGLDLDGQIAVRNIIMDMKNKGCTVFINSHNLDEVQRICNKLAFIKDGRIVDKGETHELLSKYKVETLEELYSKLIGFSKVDM